MATEFKAFDNQVTFYCTFQALEGFIVSEAIDAAIPEADDYPDGSVIRSIYHSFRLYLSSTDRIVFKLHKDADDDLKQFESWWKFAQNNTDYATIWGRYRKAVTGDIQDTWQDAIGNAIPSRLLAPPEVWPEQAGAPEETDPNALTLETSI